MMIYSQTALAERFFSGNSATYEHIANLSTLGLDRWWKRKIVNKLPQHPRQILDQACGTGLLTFKMAQRFPLCRIIGVDLQDEYLASAKKKLKLSSWVLSNLSMAKLRMLFWKGSLIV